MVQLLKVEYCKEEERVILISNATGVLIGIPTDVLPSYLTGLFAGLELTVAHGLETSA